MGLDASEFFVPLIPTMIGGALWVTFIAFLLGKKERKRLGSIHFPYAEEDSIAQSETAATIEDTLIKEESDIKRPKLLWVNLLIVLSIMTTLILNLLPAPVLFLIGFVILVFAAGVFAGILSGTKMVDAMANTLVSIIPESLGAFFPLIVAFTSMPFTFVLSNDAYYFGVLPILAEAASAYGIAPIEIARASILGQPVHLMSPLVASTILLVGMIGKDIGDHQRFA